MEEYPLINLIEQFLQGTISPEDNQKLQHLIATDTDQPTAGPRTAKLLAAHSCFHGRPFGGCLRRLVRSLNLLPYQATKR